MKKLSIKAKVTFLYTAVFVLFTLFLLSLIIGIVSNHMIHSIRAELKDEVYENMDVIGITPDGYDCRHLDQHDDGISTLIYDSSRSLMFGKVPSGFPTNTPFELDTPHWVHGESDLFYVYDIPYRKDGLEKITFRGIASLNEMSDLLKTILLISAVLTPLLLCTGLFVGYYTTQRAFRPVCLLIEAAAKIRNGNDLSKRIHMEGAEDEIKALADSFDEMFDRLSASFEREKQFTSDASHELRTPNTVIQAECEYALTQLDHPEELASCIEGIRRQSFKMTRLIQDLMLLAHAENNQYRLEIEAFDLAELIEMIIEEVRQNPKHIQILFDRSEPLPVNADQMLIMRLFMNLINNAIKYGKQNGTVQISVKQTGTLLSVSIADNGIGIGQEHLTKIWDRFYQVNKSRTANNDSSMGLGLSMVKWIVSVHHGTIRAESTLGEGTEILMEMEIGSEP